MWSRVVEIMYGVWLLISPFIFRHPEEQWTWWATDLTCGFLVILNATLCFWPPMRWAHLLQLLVAAWLLGFGYFSSPYPSPPAMQNDIVLGLLLTMHGLIPSDATIPPTTWQEFNEQRQVG